MNRRQFIKIMMGLGAAIALPIVETPNKDNPLSNSPYLVMNGYDTMPLDKKVSPELPWDTSFQYYANPKEVGYIGYIDHGGLRHWYGWA